MNEIYVVKFLQPIGNNTTLHGSWISDLIRIFQTFDAAFTFFARCIFLEMKRKDSVEEFISSNYEDAKSNLQRGYIAFEVDSFNYARIISIDLVTFSDQDLGICISDDSKYSYSFGLDDNEDEIRDALNRRVLLFDTFIFEDQPSTPLEFILE